MIKLKLYVLEILSYSFRMYCIQHLSCTCVVNFIRSVVSVLLQACSLFACGSCAGLLIFIIIVLLVRYNKLDYTEL